MEQWLEKYGDGNIVHLINMDNGVQITLKTFYDEYEIYIEVPEQKYDDRFFVDNKQKALYMVEKLKIKFTNVKDLRDLLNRKKKSSINPKRKLVKKCKCK